MSDQQTPVNPLLARLRIPGESYRLPSQGLFYENGELSPDVKNGELEIHPMTAIDEITLSTPDKLLSGKAIMEIFQHCIPQILKPNELLAKDVDFLLVCLRQVSFGQFMDVTYQHDCEGALNHTYSIDLQKMVRQSKQVDPTTLNEDYKATMPNGQIAVLKPMTYGNIIELYATASMSKTDDITQDEAEVLVINTLASVIRRVDDIDDKSMIREWVASIPLGWKRNLEQAAQSLTQWGIDFTTEQTCKDCKKKMSVQVSANPVSFFT